MLSNPPDSSDLALDFTGPSLENAPPSTQPEAISTSESKKESDKETDPLPLLALPRTIFILRAIGYGLLFLSFVDLAYIVIPPELTKPIWQYQTAGDLVKLIPVPLLAFMGVFYGETASRRRIERPILSLLSWCTLLIGVFFLLLIPVTLIDTVLISRYNNDQISRQVNQQQQQLDTTEKQLEKASQEQLQNLIPKPDEAGKLPDAPTTPTQAKAQLLENVKKAKTEAGKQAAQARQSVRQNLMKNTLKLVLESFVGGSVFVYVWVMTQWARRTRSYDGPGDGTKISATLNTDINSGSKLGRRRRRF